MAFFEDRVFANGIFLRVARSGGDKPALLFAHGVFDAGRCWTTEVGALEDRFDCILVDLRGHGQSDKPLAGYSSQHVADDLVALTAALGLDSISVLAHSWGASAAAVLASQHPDLVRSMVLEDPSWLEGERTPERDWSAEMLRRKALSIDELTALYLEESPTWSEDVVRECVLSFQEFSEDIAEIPRQPTLDWRRVVDKISCSTLLLTGAPERGAWISAKVAEEIRARNSQFQTASFPGAGHCIRRECPEQFQSAVKAFFDAQSLD